MINTPNRIIWHHSADGSTAHQATKINRYHKGKKFPKSALGFYGGYHILIEKDGSIFRYRIDEEIGAHDYEENVNTLGVCLAGNYSLQVPPMAQQERFSIVLRDWIHKWNIPVDRIDPHRFGDSTSCPGTKLYDMWAREIVRDDMQADPDEKLHDIIRYIKTKLSAP